MLKVVAALLVALATATGCAGAPAVQVAPQPCSPAVAITGFSDALDGASYGARRTYPLTGLSGLAVDLDGSLLALSDRSVLFTLDPRSREPRAATPLADGAGEALDAEALAVDADGTRLVASEAPPAVLRFDTAGPGRRPPRRAPGPRRPGRAQRRPRGRRRPRPRPGRRRDGGPARRGRPGRAPVPDLDGRGARHHVLLPARPRPRRRGARGHRRRPAARRRTILHPGRRQHRAPRPRRPRAATPSPAPRSPTSAPARTSGPRRSRRRRTRCSTTSRG